MSTEQLQEARRAADTDGFGAAVHLLYGPFKSKKPRRTRH